MVTEWNLKTAQFTLDARLLAPDANRVVATTAVSVSDALTATAGKSSPLLVKLNPSPNASIEATVAAASHGVLVKMVPAQQAAIEAAYQAALAKIPDGANKESGITLGTQAAQAVLLTRADADGSASENYRPSAPKQRPNESEFARPSCGRAGSVERTRVGSRSRR